MARTFGPSACFRRHLIVVTPDRDVYAEELGLLNSDIRHIRVRAAANVDPPGVNAAEIYGLPAWGQNDMNSIRDEARQSAEQERRALHAGGLVAALPIEAGVGPPAGAPPAAAVVPQAFDPNVGYPAQTLKWLAAESTEQYKHGQEVSIGAALSKGAKLAQAMPGGSVLFVERVDGADFHDFMQKPARGDCRVLEVGLNALGHPERSLREIASMCKEVLVKWSLPGRRSGV